MNYLRDAEGAAGTEAAVEAEARRSVVVQADASDEDQFARVFDAVEAELGTPDVLMDNAGVDIRQSGGRVGDPCVGIGRFA